MEIFGNIFIYLIIPFLGLVFLITGIILRKSKASVPLYIIGILGFIIPFLYLVFKISTPSKYKKEIVGEYYIKPDTTTVLSIFTSGEFEVKNEDQTLPQGKGTWKLENYDFMELHLRYDRTHRTITFINNSPGGTLDLDPWGNMDIELHKKQQ